MQASEKSLEIDGEIVIEGRVFKPVYKHLLDNMPQDLVQEMARRRLKELDEALAARPESSAQPRG